MPEAMHASTSLWFHQAWLHTGWARRVRLTIADGHIIAVETDVDPVPGEERHAVAIPGLGNLHSHAFQRAMAGLTEWRGNRNDDNFWSWRERMYQFLDRIGPDEQQAIAALAYMEMLEAGFTRVGEFHYVHNAPDGTAYADPAEMSGRIAAAAADTGIGLTLLPVFYAHSDFGGAEPKPGQRRFIKNLDDFQRLWDACRGLVHFDDARIGVAPHSLRAVTAEELAAVVALAPDGPIHIHAAEQTREVEASLAFCGQRPVEWLLNHHAVDSRWCLVHATHMTEAETARLAASGAVAGLCPLTEANLGDGVFPAAAYLRQGGVFGIGSDSIIAISVTEELRLLEYGQRLTHRARNVLALGKGRSTGAFLLDKAVMGGGRALGRPAHLLVGAPADIVTLNADDPGLCGRTGDDILDSYVFATSRSPVDCVWRYGKKWVSGGRHKAREAIIRTYRAAFERLTA